MTLPLHARRPTTLRRRAGALVPADVEEQPEQREQRASARRERAATVEDWSALIALIALVALAVWVRGFTIWPQATGLNEAPYDDEGVYAEAAQLLVEGKHPYRDYIYAHPPLGPLLLAPAVEYHYTTWGSPTSFMLLRYATLAYSAVTVGLVFLIGWRLWGLLGGIVSGALLVIDPLSVWVGRHVMLEGPLLCLIALAVLLYVLGRAQDEAFLLIGAAGFFAAAAGGVKLQGLIILVAMLIDLLVRRRWGGILALLAGAFVLWLPLWAYLLWLAPADPTGQFIWLQLLRPSDGIRGLDQRVSQLVADVWLVLLLAGVGVLSLAALRLRPARPRIRRAPRQRRVTQAVRRMPGYESEGGDEPVVSLAPPEPPVAAEVDPEVATVAPGWTVLIPWTLLLGALLLISRTYYAHYGAQLALPLAVLAGATPLGIARAWRVGWAGRGVAVALLAGAIVAAVFAVPATLRAVTERSQDHLYSIVSRYAGDAVGPESGVFALDAQFPFRAARRPAREDQNRFIVDGYGMLLYHALGIRGTPLAELVDRAFGQSPGSDPYSVMYRPAAQEPLKASILRSDLVIIDKAAEARLSDDTRRWLDEHGEAVERQERYVIYRIRR